MKKSLLVIALVAMVYGLQAQEINWGARLGVNFSKLNGNDHSGYKEDYKGRVGFHLGVAADYEFRESMFVESGLYITTKGLKYDKDDVTDKLNITYLQLPVLYTYKYDLGNELKLHGKIGPYVAIGLAAKNKYEDSDYPEDNETLKGFGKGEDKTGLKRGDFGFLLGIGVSKGNYYLGVNYELGLVNIDAYNSEGDDGKSKIHTRNFNISLGYNF